MTILLVVVHVIVCFVLILVILLQAGRGAGLSWGSLGGTPQSFLGTKSATFLAKATSVSAIVFLFTCISLNLIESYKAKSLFAQSKSSKVDIDKIKKALEKIKEEKTPDQPTTSGTQNPASAPQPAAGQPKADTAIPIAPAAAKTQTTSTKPPSP